MSEQQKIQIDKFNKERAKQILKKMTPEQQDQLTSPQEKFKNLTLLNDVIESEILEDSKSIISGEAITRHIIVRATGLLGSQLPAVSLPSSKAIKIYPDKH